MKKLFSLLIVFVLAFATLFAFADEISPFIDQSIKLRYQMEARRAPHIGAEWKAHSFGAADIHDVTNCVYDGTAKTPTPVVKLNGVTMTNGTDFSFSYANNTNAGWATLKVSALKAGTYGGQSKSFRINPLTLVGNAVVSNIADQASTGKPVRPKPVVTLGDKLLSEGVDYNLAYDRNVAVGTNAQCAVYGVGNYCGTVFKTFKIVVEE